LATADTLVRSIAKRCRIQRLQRRVVLARGSQRRHPLLENPRLAFDVVAGETRYPHVQSGRVPDDR
jgi:predicted house-cleaning NTP pyrophosphatase (Maf/HAM1 superfamily)